MDEWDFYQCADGKWSWRSVKSGGVTFSIDAFVSFVEAVSHAARHGFKPGVSKIASIIDDRRSAPRRVCTRRGPA